MNKITAEKIIEKLTKYHKDAKCELNHSNPFELLVAVMLSAQCTDKRVNEVTKELFKVVKTPQEFAKIDIKKLESLIFSCGFYKNKAKNIKETSKEIISKYGGNIPKSREILQTLPGVGRKTANVVSSVAFSANAIAVDTHVFRVSNRIGLTNAKTPLECENRLMKLLNEKIWSKTHHVLIFHGRYVCKSQKPNCVICPVLDECKYYKKLR